jgi:hypothetical protein
MPLTITLRATATSSVGLTLRHLSAFGVDRSQASEGERDHAGVARYRVKLRSRTLVARIVPQMSQADRK